MCVRLFVGLNCLYYICLNICTPIISEYLRSKLSDIMHSNWVRKLASLEDSRLIDFNPRQHNRRRWDKLRTDWSGWKCSCWWMGCHRDILFLVYLWGVCDTQCQLQELCFFPNWYLSISGLMIVADKCKILKTYLPIYVNISVLFHSKQLHWMLGWTLCS